MWIYDAKRLLAVKEIFEELQKENVVIFKHKVDKEAYLDTYFIQDATTIEEFIILGGEIELFLPRIDNLNADHISLVKRILRDFSIKYYVDDGNIFI